MFCLASVFLTVAAAFALREYRALVIGMALVADAATLMLLGDKWRAAIPFVAVFALIGSLRVLAGPIPTMLLVTGRSKLQAANACIEFSVFVVSALVLVPRHGFIGLAYSRLVSAIAISLVHFSTGRIFGEMRVGQIAATLWRPTVGVTLMAALLPLLSDPVRGPLFELILKVAAGAAIYVSWIAASWWLAGRPDGIESMVLGRLSGGRVSKA